MSNYTTRQRKWTQLKHILMVHAWNLCPNIIKRWLCSCHLSKKKKKVVVTKAWPWTMLLQLQTFCCGETRRKHLHISLLFFCCFTGFFFLGELSSHLRPRFCCWLVLSFMDLALYHQRCKHRCPWKLGWIIIAYYFTLWSFIQSNFFELLIITSMCIGF